MPLQLLQLLVDELACLGAFHPMSQLLGDPSRTGAGDPALTPVLEPTCLSTANRTCHANYPFGLSVIIAAKLGDIRAYLLPFFSVSNLLRVITQSFTLFQGEGQPHGFQRIVDVVAPVVYPAPV